jgi:hypothetical integral membrane protein (TIGR02206 family)
MSNWIIFGHGETTLKDFSAPHLAAISTIVLFCAVLAVFGNRFTTEKSKKTFRVAFAAFIVIQQALLYIWYTVAGEWSIEITLPVQLCDLSVFLSIAVLLTKRQFITELLYYWGIGGATQAILTPDIGSYTWPHFVFYQFFISHSVILLTCIYMIVSEKFRPSPRSVLRTLLITNLYGILILFVNRLTGGNYLFLSTKPAGGSLLDLLGPWPWYLLSLDAVALILFTLLYLPFTIGKGKFGSTGIGKGSTGNTGSTGISAIVKATGIKRKFNYGLTFTAPSVHKKQDIYPQ